MATDDHWLDGRAILVVEDACWMADDLRHAPESNGARIVGPAARLIHALHVAKNERIDGAVRDTDPASATCDPPADRRTERSVPFPFAPGYDADAPAPEWQSAGHVEKPFSAGAVVSALRPATAMGGPPA